LEADFFKTSFLVILEKKQRQTKKLFLIIFNFFDQHVWEEEINSRSVYVEHHQTGQSSSDVLIIVAFFRLTAAAGFCFVGFFLEFLG
jgi:hypothetical protein